MIAEHFELSGNSPVAPGHFTGRQSELALIESGLRSARVALVEGMPGIGKTALLAELATRAGGLSGARRVVWVSLGEQCDLLERLDAGLQASGVTAFTSYLSQTGLAYAERLMMFCALLRKAPTLLIVDDVHLLGGEQAVSFIRRLASYLGPSRAVLSTRVRLPTGLEPLDLPKPAPAASGSTSDSAFSSELVEVTLSGLPLAQASALLAGLLAERGRPASGRDLDELAASVDGHPLWLKLAVSVMLAEGLQPSELLAPFQARRTELGKALLERSWAGLSLTEKRLLSRLAVFRGLAEPAALLTLVGPELLDRIAVLRDRFLVEEGPGRCTYLHPVVRDFCLGRLPESERHILWMDLANWYEARGERGGAESLSSYVEAYHYCILAADDGRAYRLLLRFMNPLLLRGRSSELAPMLDRALATIFEPDVQLPLTKARLLRNQGRAGEARVLLADVPEPKALQEHAALLTERGQLEQDAGRYERALKHYYAALELARQAAEQTLSATLLSRIATICKDRGEYDRAIKLYEQALEVERACGTPEGVAFTLHNLAKICYFQGEHEKALRAHHEAMALWEEAGDRLSVLLAKNGIANVLRDRGEVNRAEELYAANLAEYRALSNPFGESYTLANLGHLRLLRGEHREAAALLDEAVALARSMGNRLGEALALDRLGDVRRATGRLAEAGQFYDESLKLKRELHNSYGISITLNCLGDLRRESGDYARAQKCYDEALGLARRMRDKDGIARALEGKAVIAGDRGDFAGARAQFEEALSLRRHMEEKRGIGRALSYLGHLAGQSGEVERAFEFYREGMELFQRMANRKEIQRTLGCLAQLHANLEQYDRATLLASESLELSRQLEDRKGEAVALTQLGQIALHRRELPQARRWLESSLELREAIGDSRGLVASLEPLALCLLEQGLFDEARVVLVRAGVIAAEQGFERVALVCRAHEVLLALRTGRLDEAAAAADGLLEKAIQTSFSEGVAYAFRLQGFLACRQGQPERAAELLRQASDLYRKLSIVRECARVDRELEDVGKERLVDRLERRSAMLENSRRVEQELLAAEGRPLTALAADLGDTAHALPSGVKQDRRARFRGETHPFAELIARHQGRPVKLVGQALLCVFDEPAAALAAARDLRRSLPSLHPGAPALRAGLQTGPLLVAGAEVFGEAAGLAARLHGLAQPGEILLGADTLEALKGPLPAVAELEPQRVRGRQNPLRVYRLNVESD